MFDPLRTQACSLLLHMVLLRLWSPYAVWMVLSREGRRRGWAVGGRLAALHPQRGKTPASHVRKAMDLRERGFRPTVSDTACTLSALVHAAPVSYVLRFARARPLSLVLRARPAFSQCCPAILHPLRAASRPRCLTEPLSRCDNSPRLRVHVSLFRNACMRASVAAFVWRRRRHSRREKERTGGDAKRPTGTRGG